MDEWMNRQTNGRTDGQTNESPLCSTGLHPLRGCCPKGNARGMHRPLQCYSGHLTPYFQLAVVLRGAREFKIRMNFIGCKDLWTDVWRSVQGCSCVMLSNEIRWKTRLLQYDVWSWVGRRLGRVALECREKEDESACLCQDQLSISQLCIRSEDPPPDLTQIIDN